jgi:hypothetical protein
LTDGSAQTDESIYAPSFRGNSYILNSLLSAHASSWWTYLGKGISINAAVDLRTRLALLISGASNLRWSGHTPLIPMIFLGPPAAAPIEGLSSHMTHFTPGRTRASDSITFLQVLMTVADGVAISEAYLTGIYYQLRPKHCSLTL